MPVVSDSALSREFAERFRELYDAEGAEAIDAEGSQAMVSLGAMLYRVVGPDRFLQVVDMVLHSVERGVPTILRRWAYQIIPADDAEPMRTGIAMMSDTPDYYELRQIVEPHLVSPRRTAFWAN